MKYPDHQAGNDAWPLKAHIIALINRDREHRSVSALRFSTGARDEDAAEFARPRYHLGLIVRGTRSGLQMGHRGERKRFVMHANEKTIIAALALAGSILRIVFFFRERLRRNFHYSLQV
jgi:hypothetical protein